MSIKKCILTISHEEFHREAIQTLEGHFRYALVLLVLADAGVARGEAGPDVVQLFRQADQVTEGKDVREI